MKNMKLTNLSLSVLVALGLVACGGSDNKDNAPVDKKPDTGHTDAGGGSDNGNKDTGPKIENNGKEVPQDPRRAAPTLEVEKNVADSTRVEKQLYIDRQSRDAIAGYNGRYGDQNILDATSERVTGADWKKAVSDLGVKPEEAPITNGGLFSYNPGSTDATDILRGSSLYNYYKEQSASNSLNKNGGIHADPTFSYAKGNDGKYYRVKPNGTEWNNIKSTTTFSIVQTKEADQKLFKYHALGTKIPMTEIVFIPNVLALEGGDKKLGNDEAYVPTLQELNNTSDKTLPKLTVTTNKGGLNKVDLNNIAAYDLNRGIVKYKEFSLAGVKYNLVEDFNTNNILLDLSKVPVKKEIQQEPISLAYDIVNNQSTTTLNDDEVIHRTAKVGAMKLYNLPYSRSSITINQQAVDDANHPEAAPNNLFGLSGSNRYYQKSVKIKTPSGGSKAEMRTFINDPAGDGHYGAFQVVGFQTNSLPRDGRADYVGKSYGVNSVGDIHLRADFAINRAGIHGTIDNRTTADGSRKLASVVLNQIDLSNNTYEQTASVGMQSTSRAADGVASIGGRDAGRWAVALYGPNAEEASGVIDFTPAVGCISGCVANAQGGVSFGSIIDGPNGKDNGKDFEVFSAQRGSIIKDSLNPGVGVSTSK